MSAPRVERFAGSAAEWDAFVAAAPGAAHAHRFGWKRVVERVYGHDCPYLALRGADGALRGILPLADVRTAALGRFFVSMPYLNAGGPLGEGGALVDEAARLAQEGRAKVLELRCGEPLPGHDGAPSGKVTAVLDLPGTPDALFRAFPAKLRSQIRRPEKEGAEVRFGADQMKPFFRVFAHHMRDLGTPTHPLSFFREVADVFGNDAWFVCVYLGGRPAAAGCALRAGGEVEITWASALREHARAAPNMLVYWELMRRSMEAGATRFNFGRCTPGSGTHRFKMQWGAREVPLPWHRTPAGAGGPSPERGAFALATRVWKRVPLPVATLLGPRIRGAIPQ